MKLTTEQKEVLKELTEIFEYKQIEEIIEGIRLGIVDVNIYAKPEYRAGKMYQLREMFEQNPEINFKDINFDLFSEYEIEEIRAYLNDLKYSLRDLKDKADSIEKANEMLKIIQRFVDRDFKEE